MVYIHKLKDRHWQTELKIHDSTICCLQQPHFKYNDKGILKVKGQVNIYASNNKNEQKWLY